MAANIQMIANGELVSGAAPETGVWDIGCDRSFTILYRALGSPRGASSPRLLPVRAAAKPNAPSGPKYRSSDISVDRPRCC